MKTYLTILKRAWSSYGEDNCGSFAAAISYYALFSLFPLIVFVVSVLGFFIHDQQQRASIVDAIFKLLGQSVDKNSLYNQVNAFAGGRGGLGILALVGAAWSASSVFGAIRKALNVVWNVTKTRPLVPTKLLDLGMVAGVGLIIALSLVATGLLTAIQGFSNQLFGSSLGPITHIVFALLFFIVPPAISFFAFALTYWIVPHAEIRFRDVWLGSLLAAIAFQVAQIGFAIYAANFAHYDKVYGTLGAVIAFLFFMYISANILLLGGEITKEYVDVLAGVRAPEEPAQPQGQRSLEQRAIGLAKGLFVDDSHHHDTSLPYEPARKEPANPPAPMVTDEQAHPEVEAGKTEGKFDGRTAAAESRARPGGRTPGESSETLAFVDDSPVLVDQATRRDGSGNGRA